MTGGRPAPALVGHVSFQRNLYYQPRYFCFWTSFLKVRFTNFLLVLPIGPDFWPIPSSPTSFPYFSPLYLHRERKGFPLSCVHAIVWVNQRIQNVCGGARLCISRSSPHHTPGQNSDRSEHRGSPRRICGLEETWTSELFISLHGQCFKSLSASFGE